jgi:hypothetical protein
MPTILLPAPLLTHCTVYGQLHECTLHIDRAPVDFHSVTTTHTGASADGVGR